MYPVNPYTPLQLTVQRTGGEHPTRSSWLTAVHLVCRVSYYFNVSYSQPTRSQYNTVIVSNGKVAFPNKDGTFSVNTPGTYRIVSIHNQCGYSQGEGTVRIITRPQLSRVALSSRAHYVGTPFSFTYAATGKLQPGSRLRVQLVNQESGQQMILTSATALQGIYTFPTATTLTPAQYVLLFETITPAALSGKSAPFSLIAPPVVKLITGNASSTGNLGSLLSLSATHSPYSYTLLTPEQGGRRSVFRLVKE
jgi:hypothetical protein